jgi:hypothetical protein
MASPVRSRGAGSGADTAPSPVAASAAAGAAGSELQHLTPDQRERRSQLMEDPSAYVAKLFHDVRHQTRTADDVTRDTRNRFYDLYVDEAGRWRDGSMPSILPNPKMSQSRKLDSAYSGLRVIIRCRAPHDDPEDGSCNGEIHLLAYAANPSDAVSNVLQHLRRFHNVECHRDNTDAEAASPPTTPATPSKASPKKQRVPTCQRFFRNGRDGGAVRIAALSLSLSLSLCLSCSFFSSERSSTASQNGPSGVASSGTGPPSNQ